MRRYIPGVLGDVQECGVTSQESWGMYKNATLHPRSQNSSNSKKSGNVVLRRVHVGRARRQVDLQQKHHPPFISSDEECRLLGCDAVWRLETDVLRKSIAFIIRVKRIMGARNNVSGN
jgi:hypothetical protein